MLIFYKKVCEPNTPELDTQFANRVGELLEEKMRNDPDISRAPFVDVGLVLDCIQKLRLHKAAGHDNITNEHIIFGGNHLAVHLCLLFNAMLRHSFVPSEFRFGMIKPILKDKHGDITSTDMYRGITLTPVLSKLFESVLLELYADSLTSDPLQFGFKKDSSCAHALFTFSQ